MTPLEQRQRNELGQLTHRNLKLAEQNAAMRRDLTGQRDDMQRAIEQTDIREMRRILQTALDYRVNNREQRKVKA